MTPGESKKLADALWEWRGVLLKRLGETLWKPGAYHKLMASHERAVNE